MSKYLTIIWIIALACVAKADDRPNILWITCEDISPYLGSYDCAEAQTPNLDRLAEQGIRYTRAFSNAPVCAVARSTLLTGMYSSTIGTLQMRSYVDLPSSIPAFPKFLRKSGYYCTNTSKTDYNSRFIHDKDLWDESGDEAHWQNRKEGQPFFAVFSFTETHERRLSSEWIERYVEQGKIPPKPRINPQDIKLPPYHPDLPEIRQDWARLHDLITFMDQRAGEILRELEETGEADNTIVFFFSDHGGMLSRSKRYIYDGGTRVPLIVKFPEKWQHLESAVQGRSSDRLVSFVDFPKTVLSLAGAEIPDQMQGTIFLGMDKEPPPPSVHLFRDRMSECYDFSRAVTDGRYYYIQNFMPHGPRGRGSRYGFTVQANWVAWENHYEAGKCDPIQSQFFQAKPVVEFFDTQADPWQVENLADQAEYADKITQMSNDLDNWMIETRDTGLIPEAMFSDLAGPERPYATIYEYAQSNQYPVADLLQIAKEAAWGDKNKLPEYLDLMTDGNPVARYYGAYALFLVRVGDTKVQTALLEMIANDAIAANRIMAAQALGRSGDPDAAYLALCNEANSTESGYVFLLAINALRYAHVGDRLTLEDWRTFQEKEILEDSTNEPIGLDYANRIIADSIELWPDRRPVD